MLNFNLVIDTTVGNVAEKLKHVEIEDTVSDELQHLSSSLEVVGELESQYNQDSLKASSSDIASQTSDESKKSDILDVSISRSSDSSSVKDADSRSEASDDHSTKLNSANDDHVQLQTQSQAEVSLINKRDKFIFIFFHK